MVLEWLRLQDFRNISQAHLRFCPELNLITGANGQGKSNLLEAVGLLATGRSFRRASPGIMRRSDRERFTVSGGVRSGALSHRLEVTGEAGRQVVRLDGKPMAAVSVMERVLTAVIVTPETPGLVRGGPGERRGFLDWVIFSATRRHGVESREYLRALKARHQLLRQPGREVGRELDAWEAHLAVLGARIAWRRHGAVARLARVLPGFLEALELLPDRYALEFSSQVGAALAGGDGEPEGGEGAVPLLREALAKGREADRRSGTTGFGPHRDELVLRLDGRPLARFGSRGQQKRFAFALKLAEAELLEAALGQPPVMVLDDPASELDREGLARLMALLSRQGRQVFLAAREAGEIPWPGGSRLACAVNAGEFHVITECEHS